jgi:hypothetical protein
LTHTVLNTQIDVASLDHFEVYGVSQVSVFCRRPEVKDGIQAGNEIIE